MWPAHTPLAEWDGPAAGDVRWQYSSARQLWEASLADALAALLELPRRRVVPQASSVDASEGTVTADVWILDLHGDPSSDERPAPMVQAYFHEWRRECDRREGGAPPAPPPPPPSMPPEPPPPAWDYVDPVSQWAGRWVPPPPPPPPPRTVDARTGSDPTMASGGGTLSYSSSGDKSGEPYGAQRVDWPCPLSLLGWPITELADATPPSPPASPPPPPPPSPPSPPPSPPYIECTFIACEVVSDEEVERREREAIESRGRWEPPPDP